MKIKLANFMCVVTAIMMMVTSVSAFAPTMSEDIEDVQVSTEHSFFEVSPEMTNPFAQIPQANDFGGAENYFYRPTSANIFGIKSVAVYPLYKEKGVVTSGYGRKATISDNRTRGYTMNISTELVDSMIKRVKDDGFEPIGWRVVSTFYMNSYQPISLWYYRYHDGKQVENQKGVSVYNNYATIRHDFLMSESAMKTCQIGYSGHGNMVVYYPQNNISDYLRPTFSTWVRLGT